MDRRNVLQPLLGGAAFANVAWAQGAGWGWGAVSGASIIVREGLEAALVLGAVAAYLRAAGTGARLMRGLWGGVIAALVSSAAAWWLAEGMLLGAGEARLEALEGWTALLAAAVLFFVIGGLFHQAYVADWTERMRARARQAAARGSVLGLAVLGFLVVFREGFETVLFVRVLLAQAPADAVGAGVLLGALLTAVLVLALARGGARLPLRAVFRISGWLLLALALSFVGHGVHELQEAGIFSEIPWWKEALDTTPLRWLGLRGTLETLAAQAVYLLLVAAVFVLGRRRARLAA
ncbi:FTR1 family iron permease [Oceanithermus sp.]